MKLSQRVLIPVAVFGVVGATIYLALFVITDDYVPSAEMLLRPTNPTRAFLIQSHDVVGIFGNMDVDCMVYEYATSIDGKDFWEAIDESAAKDGWRLTNQTRDRRRYIRIISAQGEEIYHSAEEVRVAFDATTGRVAIGWIQADTRELPAEFPGESSEGNFARKFLWPKFDAASEAVKSGQQ